MATSSLRQHNNGQQWVLCRCRNYTITTKAAHSKRCGWKSLWAAIPGRSGMKTRYWQMITVFPPPTTLPEASHAASSALTSVPRGVPAPPQAPGPGRHWSPPSNPMARIPGLILGNLKVTLPWNPTKAEQNHVDLKLKKKKGLVTKQLCKPKQTASLPTAHAVILKHNELPLLACLPPRDGGINWKNVQHCANVKSWSLFSWRKHRPQHRLGSYPEGLEGSLEILPGSLDGFLNCIPCSSQLLNVASRKCLSLAATGDCLVSEHTAANNQQPNTVCSTIHIWTRLTLPKPAGGIYCYQPLKENIQDIQGHKLAQDHMAGKQRSWDSNLESLALESLLLIMILHCLLRNGQDTDQCPWRERTPKRE